MNSFIPVALVGMISYDSIHSILNTKIQDGIRSNLTQVVGSMENAISNLNHVSQQLAYEGTIGKKLNIMLTSEQPFERSRVAAELKNELNLITLTNPGVGLNFYYFSETGKFEFESLPVKPGAAPETLPLLFDYYGMSYYGPHATNYRLGDQIVISALRKVELPRRDDVFVYLESGFNITQNIMESGYGGQKASFLFLDNAGNIVFSQLSEQFPAGSAFSAAGTQGMRNGFYWFKETSNQGWSVVSAISAADYNREINLWYRKFMLFSLFAFGISLFTAWLLWKMVYKPLKVFNAEIRRMANHQAEAAVTSARCRIPEFDYLLKKFSLMKEQIWELFAEIKQKEKRRLNLEVEKLLYQINPHFLMNTLNTVHWLALVNGQTEIDRLVQALNKLLHYNLGKLGEYSNVGDEISAVEQYLILQQIRYDFIFDVKIDVDEDTLKTPMPRFILQPLVENALYHGFRENGYVRLQVARNRDLEITIIDNGVGMSEETIERLLHNEQPEHRKVGMGIGLNYVKRMIEAQYDGKASLDIQSAEGKGTRIHLRLPVTGGACE
ncbi:sensor histidine kinase [Paenibacillus sp.]|uniref:sensor histidine kinase n=1 Tax=Paenibacillus sp. TaxID=58172 RepID=UPI002D3504CA|nr:sensor histidine kinase [Paenibacillus sp.]HZG86710.1 sensor histidine kinase [Paenibacillus sp.]